MAGSAFLRPRIVECIRSAGGERLAIGQIGIAVYGRAKWPKFWEESVRNMIGRLRRDGHPIVGTPGPNGGYRWAA